MGLRIDNTRYRGRDGRIVRSIHSADGEHWFEDPERTIPIDPQTAAVAGTADDVLFFVVFIAVLVYLVKAAFEI